MLAGLSLRTRDFAANADAVAATEFAIVLPFMLMLLLGGFELGNGLAIGVKVSATSHSVADLVAQNTQVSASRMLDILQASSSIIAPYPTKDAAGNSLMTVTVSEVSTDANGNATVQWSQSTSATGARTVGQKMTLSAFTTTTPTNANISLILGEVSYAYKPNLGSGVTGPVTIADSYYLFPRCATNGPATSSTGPYYDVKLTSTTTCTCIQHVQQKIC
ncbi:TadE/TadG family type IV pilus assembly protein [Bradyrhizobium sp. STM 3809]|uniref:TadE/TadG family type IV pilus assembly protein n=1 Tax=Bradyrhizobium sp. STM 3809 TaxID=551936 RepID=UPI0002409E30|nr:TadE/TadG family type IV pilus assembly protein [Bradyrhizobium sp. STM 3809]CCE02966.1 conserved hypothetical protein [Bradyrhizobium sp. STM 3809]